MSTKSKVAPKSGGTSPGAAAGAAPKAPAAVPATDSAKAGQASSPTKASPPTVTVTGPAYQQPPITAINTSDALAKKMKQTGEEDGGAGESFGMKATPGAPAFSHELRRRTPKAGAFARLKGQAQAEKKFNNSTNSLYISETPTAPDERELTMCAAKAVKVLIATDEANKTGGSPNTTKLSVTPPAPRAGGKEPREMIFDERVHPLKSNLKKGVPTEDDVYRYMRIIYKRTRMQPECIVMTVSYIEKVLKNPSVVMNVHTWRRIVLAALIVADKVFEDYAVWNADFLSLFPQTDIQDLNTLEREFLNFLQYATTFKASDYAKYYFALKELSDNKDILPAKPLSQEQADRLESGSKSLSTKSKKDGDVLERGSFSDFHSVGGMDLAMSADPRKKNASRDDSKE